MDGLLLHIFKYEIAQQCRFILRCATQLEEAVEGWEEREGEFAALDMWETHELRRYEFYVAMMGLDDETATDVWFALQGLLVAAANISKMLWGSGGEKAQERVALRSHLAVQDGSVLESPSLRNDLSTLTSA